MIIFSIMILIAGISAGGGACLVAFFVVGAFWTMVIAYAEEAKKKENQKKDTIQIRVKTDNRDPIDRYMDENYADINWLRKGKL